MAPAPSYDANGNMTGRTVGGVGYTLTYDVENRLAGVSGGASATFTYDGDGNRVKGVAGGVTTCYVGNYYEHGSTVKKYYYHAGKRVAMHDGATLNWLLGEHLGSTTVTANSSGTRTGEIRYKPYGASRYTYGTTPTTYHFTGQREESTIGLYYYGARWYDPALGRFVQADSIVPNGAYPQDLNRYTYGRNNPVKYSDPNGHWFESVLDIGGIVWDIYDIKQQGLNWKTGGALAVDIAFLILPFATGGGAIVRGISHADDVEGAGRLAGHLGDATHAALAAANALDDARTLAKVGANAPEGAKLIKRLAEASTHGKLGKGTIVSLGHSRTIRDLPDYAAWAKKTGATYLQATDEVFGTLNSSGKWWSVNQQFLDDALAAGVDRFHLQLPGAANPGNYADEIEYLLDKGFQKVFQDSEWWLVRP